MSDDIVTRLREQDRWLARAQVTEEAADEIQRLRAEVARLERIMDDAERALDEVMTERDKAHELLDRIAAVLGTMAGEDFGEHSSGNDPWANALEWAEHRAADGAGSVRCAVNRKDRSDLIRIAAGLARGTYLPAIDTENWYVSTPVAERRRIIKAIEDAEESHKLLALALRRLADTTPAPQCEHGVKPVALPCPFCGSTSVKVIAGSWVDPVEVVQAADYDRLRAALERLAALMPERRSRATETLWKVGEIARAALAGSASMDTSRQGECRDDVEKLLAYILDSDDDGGDGVFEETVERLARAARAAGQQPASLKGRRKLAESLPDTLAAIARDADTTDASP